MTPELHGTNAPFVVWRSATLRDRENSRSEFSGRPRSGRVSKQKTLLGVAAALIALCVVARLLPHPPNFAPAMAIAMFGCVLFPRRWHASAVVAAAMLVGDWFIGFYDLGVMLTVYASLLMPFAARRFLRKATAVRVGTVAVLSGVGFYLTTNAAVWFFTNTYPPDLEGLVASYIAGLPFLKWTLLGNLFYSGILFGAYGILGRGVLGSFFPERPCLTP